MAASVLGPKGPRVVGKISSAGVRRRSSSSAWAAAPGAGEFGGAKVSGGEVEEGDARGGVREVDGGEVVGLLGGEGWIERSAGSEDAGDFAAHDFLRQLRVFHLVADGDAIAETEEARDVVFRGVVGDAAHGHAAFFVARGEGELQLAGGGFGVVEEELVEVAEAEEEQRVGVLAFGGQVLAHERGLGVGESGTEGSG